MTINTLRMFLLAAVFLFAAGPPAAAGPDAGEKVVAAATGGDGAGSVLLAEGISVGKWLSGGRSRVVQLCTVAMCLALFIMMRKLT